MIIWTITPYGFFTHALEPDVRWFVGAGLAGWFHDIGCENVIEMRWWDENCIPELATDVRFIFVPAQHWSKRTLIDTNKVKSDCFNCVFALL